MRNVFAGDSLRHAIRVYPGRSWP